MALAIEIIGTVADQAGKTATHTVYAATGFTIAEYIGAAQALAQLVDGVIDGVIQRMEFCVGIDISALTDNAAEPTSDVEEISHYQFLTADGRRVNWNIPAIDDTLSVAGSDAEDSGQGAIAALESLGTDGIVTGGGTIAPCDVNEDDIVSFVFAREEVRNSGARS